MRRLAHWSFLHRRLVLVGWVGLLAVTFFVGSTTGSNYANGTKLSGTESAAAQNLLQQAAPGVSGDTERMSLQLNTRRSPSRRFAPPSTRRWPRSHVCPT